jgi:hypothetical protein
MGMAPLLGALISLVLAGCSSATLIPNPPASALQVSVTLFDHADSAETSSATTFLAIDLQTPETVRGTQQEQSITGSDTQTLVCNGVTMSQNNYASAPQEKYTDYYVGDVPPQQVAYTCIYYWNAGAQQATLTIPIPISNSPQIQAPASHATLQKPDYGGPGVTVTYAPANNGSATVTATAADFNKRSAKSDSSGDVGSVTIGADKFPSNFSVGWGTLKLTRAISHVDLSRDAGNLAFASVTLDTYEQIDQIPVFWL